MRRYRGRVRRGFSLIELVVASTLLVLVLSGTSLVVANAERQLLESRLQDTATALGVSLAERSAAFGCGLAVDPVSSATTTAAERCRQVFSGQAAAGDARFTATDTDGQSFDVTVSTRWRQTGTGAACYASSGVAAAQLPRPALLERTVTLSYLMAGQPRQRKVTTVQATPDGSSYAGAGTGVLLVRASPGTMVTLGASGGTPISRFASACDTNAAAVFPFLPPGEYRLGRDGAAAQPVTISSGQVTEVVLP